MPDVDAEKTSAIPEDMQPYIRSVSYWTGGASVHLVRAGLEYGKTNDGARHLARFVRSLDGWVGHRNEGNVAAEIKAHCVAWRWFPPLRGRANPIDLEFHMQWPENLVLSATSIIRRCLKGHKVR